MCLFMIWLQLLFFPDGALSLIVSTVSLMSPLFFLSQFKSLTELYTLLSSAELTLTVLQFKGFKQKEYYQ